MSIATAVMVLLSILVAIDLVLTAGVIRRLRGDAGRPTVPTAILPKPGHRVRLEADPSQWDPAATALLDGSWLVAFVLPGCLGCDRFRRELQHDAVALPLALVGDPFVTDGGQFDDYFRTWPGSPLRVLAPAPVDTLVSFNRPDTFPTVVLLRDGVVMASGHRLTDVREAIAELEPAAGA